MVAELLRDVEATPPPTDRAASTRRRFAIPLCTAVVLVAYAVAAMSAAQSATGSDFHRRQAAAIAAGRLDIRPVPDALRSLRNPYDAGRNVDVRTHDGVQDLAYRDGHLYSAHGLTIPLLLVPAERLLGTAPPNWAITLMAGWVGVICGAWILTRVREDVVPCLPDWALGTAILAFGLCGPVPALMSTGNGYEAAIAVAFALTMAGAALLMSAVGRWPQLDRRRAAIGSSLLALAVGARPTAVAASIALVVVTVASVRAAGRSGTTRAGLRADIAALLGPYVVVVGALLWANVVRFGSPTEFGFGFQLSVWNMRTYPMGRISYLAPNLGDYLFAAPARAASFPWLRPRSGIEGLRPDVHTAEPIVGLVFLAPVLCVGTACLLAGLRSMRRTAPRFAVATLTAAAIGCVGLLAVSFPFNTSTLRYAADAAPMLLLAACASWCWTRSSRDDPAWTRRLDVAWIAALVVGVVVTACTQIPT
ncbi:MAG: hypothetical protein JST64_02015 [Actinobacteria bacterium]|nr:hypothetical protein [Actinomycetota bacterium]